MVDTRHVLLLRKTVAGGRARSKPGISRGEGASARSATGTSP